MPKSMPYITIKVHKHGGICDIPQCGKVFAPYEGFLLSASDASVQSASICDRDHK